MDDRTPKLRRGEREVERQLRELGDAGELKGLPGEGRPLPDPDDGARETWAARHILRTANTAPEWAELRREIEGRIARLRLRMAAHHQWLHDRTRLLAELPADRIVEAAHTTAARDLRVKTELAQSVSEVNALVRRYDLMVVPAMQLPLVTIERLEAASR